MIRYKFEAENRRIDSPRIRGDDPDVAARN